MKQSTKVVVLTSLFGLATMGWLGNRMITTVKAQESTSATPVDTAVTTAATTTTLTPMVDRRQAHLEEQAKLLGMTATDLQAALQGGQKFYQIAAEHGVTYDKLKVAKEAEIKARLDDMVKVGFLTQAEADVQLKLYQDQAANQPMMGLGHGGHHGF